MSGKLFRRTIALAMLGLLAWSLTVFPAYRAGLAVMLGLYALLLWWRPAWWLLVVPALLPVFDLAPWTGWFFLDEFDLLLMATVAVAYWTMPAKAGTAHDTRPAPWVSLGLILVAASVAIAAWIGIQPMPPVDADSFANYESPYNSLRVAKGYLWALLLFPLMRRHADGENIARLFVPGMLIGLGGASLAVVWERLVFPGLLNFSSDYRPTAPFSAMHTGGAALDAYLAMAFPLIAFWLPGTPSRWRLGLAFTLLLLGAYAGLTTFSRDVYLAYACSGVILGGLALARHYRAGGLAGGPALGAAVLIVAATLLLYRVFGSSGYRGFGAALGLLAAAALLAGGVRRAIAPSPGHTVHAASTPVSTSTTASPFPLPTLLAALALLLAVAAIYYLLRQQTAQGTDKGAYLAYLLSAAIYTLGLLKHFSAPAPARVGGGRAERAAPRMMLAAAAFPGLALSTALVAEHWAGAAARVDIALLIALAAALPALRVWRAKPLWQLHQTSASAGVLCAVAMAMTIPLAGSYYLGVRFSTVADDAAIRLGHWREAILMMGSDWPTQTFGMGLGRYPATYLWNNLHGEVPPTFSYAQETSRPGDNGAPAPVANPGNPGSHFLRLSPPRYQAGYGEVLRMLQHVELRSAGRYRLTLDVRRADNKTGMTVAVCRRWLLYPQDCAVAPLKLLPADAAWHRYSVELAPTMQQRRWPLRAPTQLEVSVEGGLAVLEVDNLSLFDLAEQRELLANGDFERGNARWFFSSDRNHFPWHVKNFAVNVLFETGWLGLFGMAVLLLALATNLLRRGLRGEAAAGVWLAALAGAMVVGLFDSLTDVPRLTLLMLLLVFAAAPPQAPPALIARRAIRS